MLLTSLGCLAGVTSAAAGLTLRRIGAARPGDGPGTAEAIVVLGAAVRGGRPCPELAARLQCALELWRGGWAPRIVCSGGPGEAEAMRAWLISVGVPAGALTADPGGVSTRATVGRAGGHGRVIFVTSPWHVHRTRAEARRRDVDARVCSPRRSPVDTVPLARRRQVAREVLASWWYARTIGAS